MTNIIIKKTIPILFFFYGGCLCAQAPRFFELSNQPKIDTSICREWNDNYAVLYSQSSSIGNWFHLVNASNNTVFSAKTDNTVTDMEILDDLVFYCGNNSAGLPIIGYFPVNDLLTPNLNEIVNSYSPAPYQIRPRRLEVFRVTDGLHAIVVCDFKYLTDTIRRIIADIRYDNTLNITNTYYLQSSWGAADNFMCDDIAITDNYVIVSGHKPWSGAVYMRVFDKPTIIGTDIYTATPYPNYHLIHCYCNPYPFPYPGNRFDPIDNQPVWCTHTFADKVALACLAYNRDDFRRGVSVKILDLSTTPAPMNIQPDLFIPLGSTLDPNWNVRDIRFNASANSLLMLHDAPVGSGIVKSLVTVIDNASFSSATGFYPSLSPPIHSIDHFFPMTGMLFCGNNPASSNELLWGVSVQQPNACYQDVPFSIVSNVGITDCFRIDIDYFKATSTLVILPSNVIQDFSTIYCSE